MRPELSRQRPGVPAILFPLVSQRGIIEPFPTQHRLCVQDRRQDSADVNYHAGAPMNLCFLRILIQELTGVIMCESKLGTVVKPTFRTLAVRLNRVVSIRWSA